MLHRADISSIRFERTDAQSGPVIGIVGQRGVGKTYCVRDLLYHFRDVPRIVVVSDSERFCPFYASFVSDVHSTLDDNLVQRLMDEQTLRVRDHPDTDPRMVLVLDNQTYGTSTTALGRLVALCHKCRIMVMLVSDSPSEIPSTILQQMDYVFMFRENRYQQRKTLYWHFAATAVSSMNEFTRMLDQTTTDNHSILVVHNTNPSPERMFWYRAGIPPTFCCPDTPLPTVRAFSWTELPFRQQRPVYGFTMLIRGPKKSGKTVAVLDLLRHFHDVPRIVVFTDQEGRYGQYDVMSEYEDLPPLIKQYQRCFANDISDRRLILVFDGCPWTEWIDRAAMQKLLVDCNHLPILVVFTVEYAEPAPAIVRKSARYIFSSCLETNPQTQDRVYENYGRNSMSRYVYDHLSASLPHPHSMIVMDKSKSGWHNFDSSVFTNDSSSPA